MPTRLEQLTKLLAADPADAFVLYGIAFEHAKQGDHERAIEFFDKCLAADPAYCYAYYHKAVSLQNLGRKAEAKSTLKAGTKVAKAAQDEKAQVEIATLLESI